MQFYNIIIVTYFFVHVHVHVPKSGLVTEVEVTIVEYLMSREAAR